MIVDTNVLIDSLRGKKEAIRFLESDESSYSASVISVAELYAGVKGAEERAELQEFLRTFPVHDVTEEIASRAGEYLNRYGKSHNIGIADALIASTASFFGEELATLNVKDFPMLTGLIKPY